MDSSPREDVAQVLVDEQELERIVARLAGEITADYRDSNPLIVGVLIGGVGIGGILLVPILTNILSIDVHVAVAAAMFSYIFSGIVGTFIYARERSIKWNMVFWLLVSAAPAAFLGAYALSITPARGVEFLIASLVIFAGVNAFRSRHDTQREKPPLSPPALIGTGVATGIGSALSGTGGPLIIVPLLVWLRQPALVAIGLAQTVQVPVAIMATAGNYIYGSVDFQIGGVIALGLIFGVAGGARLAHLASQEILQRVVAWVLLAVGILMLTRISLDALSA